MFVYDQVPRISLCRYWHIWLHRTGTWQLPKPKMDPTLRLSPAHRTPRRPTCHIYPPTSALLHRSLLTSLPRLHRTWSHRPPLLPILPILPWEGALSPRRATYSLSWRKTQPYVQSNVSILSYIPYNPIHIYNISSLHTLPEPVAILCLLSPVCSYRNTLLVTVSLKPGYYGF